MEQKTVRAGLILLIMYDKLQAPAFTEKLRGYGYDDVVVCSDGKAALEKLKKNEPSVVITDVELKGELNGIETGKKIRENWNIPLIFLSRLQDERTFQKVRDILPLAFLNKPVNWNELRMAIESAIHYRDEKRSVDSALNEFRQKYEEAPLPYLTLSAEGNITAVNRAWTELMGYSAGEVTGRWFGDFVPVDFHPRFKYNIDSLKKDGHVHGLENELIKKDGSKITIAFEGKAQNDLQGKFISILCIFTDITEKQRIKEKLLESEERFRLLFEEAPLGYHSLAENGGIIYVNNAWCKMLDYSKKEATGKWFGDFLAPEERDRFKENFSVFRLKGKAFDIHYKMIKKDGSEVYIMIDGIVHYDEEGNYIQSHCILKDITAQKLTENALLESDKKFRNLIESAGDIIYLLDNDLKYLYGNNLCLERYGLTKEEFIGKNYSDFHSSESLDEFNKKIRAVQKSKKPIHYEHQSTIDGRHFLRTLSPIMDSETKGIVSITVISRDITGLKKIEQALQKRENEIRTITDNIPALVSYVDAGGYFRFVNRQYEKWFGIPSEEIIGKHYSEVLGKVTYKQIKDHVNKALAGQRVNYENKVNCLDGQIRWISAAYIPDFDDTGKVSGFYSLNTDITERKQAEEIIRASEERFRGLADSITDVFFALDKDLKYTYWNKASEKLTGVAEKNAIGKSLNEIFPDTQQTKITKDVYLDVLRKRKARTFITEFTLAGKDFVFEISAYPAEEGVSVFVKDITKRRQLEQKLQESEELYRKIFEDCPFSMVLTDRDFHFISTNPAFCKMIGYSEEELKKMTFVDITHPDHLEADRENVEKMLKGKILSYRTEKRYIARNGDIRWGNLITTTIRAQDGKFLYALAMIEDITERIQSEEKLVQSEERYRQLVELSPDAIMIHREGKFVFVNRATLELFGANDPVELIGQPVMERVHPDYRKIVDVRIKTIIGNQPNVPLIEEKFIRLDGTVFDVEVSANQISYHNTIAVQVIARDITKRKQVENALRASEHKLKEAQSIGRIGSWEFDVEHGEIQWSDETYKLYERDPALGPPTPDEEASYYTSEQAATLREYSRRAIETGEQFEYDLQARLPGGRTAFFTASMHPVRDESGRIVRLFGTVQDITMRRQTEEKLHRVLERLDLATSVAHVGIWDLDILKNELVWDDEMYKLFNVRREDFEGTYNAWLSRIHPDDRANLDRFSKLVRNKNEEFRTEFRIKWPDGNIRYLEAHGKVIRDEKGKPVRMIGINIDDTERILMEKSLRESEEKFRNLFNNVQVGMFRTKYDGSMILDMNERFLQIFGCTREEMEGLPSVIRWADPREREEMLLKLELTGQVTDFECGMLNKSGEERRCLTSLRHYREQGILEGSIIDITEKKKAEKELYESRQMLQTVLDTIPVAVFWKDRDLIYQGGNHTFKNSVGLNSTGEIIGKTDFEFPWDEDQAKSFREYDKRIIESGTPEFNIIEPFTQADGTHSWARTNKVPMHDRDGNIIGILGTYEDITDRKQAEEALRKSRELFEKTFRSQKDAIFILDAKTPPMIIECNPATMEIFGYNVQEIIGRTTALLHVDETALRNFQENLYAAIAEQGFLHIPEFNMRRKDGTIFTTENSVMPLEDEKGNCIGWVSVVRDITKRILIEETLRTSQSQLSNAMNIARLGYWEYDVTKDLFTFNDHFYNIFHTSAEKVGGYTLSSARYAELFVHPEDQHLVNSEIRKALETTDPNFSSQLEHRMIFTNGETGYIAVRFFIIKDEQGRTIKTYGANQDITERKQAVIALANSEAMLSSILRTVSVGIGVVKNRIFEWTNETYQKITGFSESELKGKSTRMVYPDDEEFKRAERMYDLMKKHNVGSVKVKHKHKNGKIIHVLISIAPIIPGDLNSGVAFTLLDITDRKKAEKEILEKSEDLSLLVKINTLVNNGADMDSITGELSREIKRIFDCDGAAAMLMDKKGESLVIRDIPFTKAKITGFERFIGQKLSGLKIKVSADFIRKQLLESEKILLINSPDEICRLVQKYAKNSLLQKYIPDIIKLLGINSVIIIPLVSNNKPMGIIEISSRKVFKQDILERISNLSENLANIIARKQAESELNASETRFRAFMENLPVMTYMKNKEGKFIYGNKATLKFADRTSETYTDSLIDEFLPGDLAKWMKQMDEKVLKNNKIADLGEWKWVKENREQWFKEFKFPIFLPDEGTIIGGWMMDITTNKAAESALRESEARYKDLVEKAGIAIMTDDADGNITYFNREFARLFGYTITEMKKQSLETLIHAGDLKQRISYHKKRMKGEKVPNSYELRGIQKNGNEICVAFEVTVLTAKDKITGTRNYMWDVTNRKKNIEALENSESRFRELFNNMSSGVAVYLFDPAKKDFKFKDINKAGMRISRVKNKKDVLNRYLLECFPGAKDLGLWNALIRVRKSGIPEKVQNTHYMDDRLNQYVENFVYKLKTGELITVYDDIGERVLAEQDIWRSYEEIRKLSQHLETVREEERKQIAGELHDELGQILTAIKMDVSWIRNRMPPEREGIKKRAGSTIQIIDEAIGSVQRLSVELRPRMLDDLGLLETLKAFFKEYEGWANIPVRNDLPEKEPDLIPGQEISVFRIIQESLTNIARHAGATEVKLIIKERNYNLDLKIQDNGIGIPDEKIHSSESYGILSMRERIQGWGGTFKIKGEEGAGTTIIASIPVGKVKT